MEPSRQKKIVWGAMVWNHIMYLIIVILLHTALEISGLDWTLIVFYLLLTIGFTLSVIVFRYCVRNEIDQSRGIVLQALPQAITLLGLVIHLMIGVFGVM
jgi:hypothetical protein